MKKDIGIITWHYYSNYGSALQAYSLQATIQKLGYSCEFINYRKKKFKSSNIKTAIKYIISYLSIILPKEKRKKYGFRFSRFEYEFLKQRKRTYNAETVKKCNSRYNIFICGSDQIWAPNVFDPIYFLSFVDSTKPKIAYAPSIGLNSIPKELQIDYCNLLSRFDCLSVREEKGAEIINDICNLKAEVVLDPTFLLEEKDWKEVAIEPNINGDYIFVYFLGENKLHRESVRRLAVNLQCKVIAISHFDIDRKIADYVDNYAGPREFLGYIKNAKFILTDSFHGTALSIIFKKNFYVFERFSHKDKICQNSRINNILNKINLKDRLISYGGFIHEICEIDYNDVNILLQAERLKSINYLKNSISKTVNKNNI
jgi:preprotein translocase subunit YajC